MSIDRLKSNLVSFKRRYFVNKILRGALVSGISIGLIVLVFSLLEDFFWFSQPVRFVLFIVLVGLLGYSIAFKIVLPLLSILQLKKGISDEHAAREIGKHFPEVDDKLLNYLQLSQLSNAHSSLISAALEQKTKELGSFSFKEAINLRVNLKYAYYFGGVASFILLASFINPSLFTDSTSRIVQFNKAFVKPAPFSFNILSELVAYANDEYTLEVEMAGSSVPEHVFLVENGRKIKMNKSGNKHTFIYPSISADKIFNLEGAGYSSEEYQLLVHTRPELKKLSIAIEYPAYTGLTNQTQINTGSLIVPEGSQLRWSLESSDTKEAFLIIDEDSSNIQYLDNQEFSTSKTVYNSFEYELRLSNTFAFNRARIIYEIEVIKDATPEIEVDFIPDTVTFRSIVLSGSISDDYGFTTLQLMYKPGSSANYRSLPISIDLNQNYQQFFYQWDFDSLDLGSEGFMEVYVRVSDNDKVNGKKSAVSQKFVITSPDDEEIDAIIESKSNDSRDALKESVEDAESLNERLKELESRLKNKKELGWQDEKLLDDLIAEKRKLEEQIEALKQSHQQLLESQKEFGKQSEKLQKKSQQLQDLINEVLDEETKKLYDELQKLLKEEGTSEEVLKQLSKIQSKEQNLERELERALELFKRMKLETTLEQAAKKLEELGEKEEKLGSKMENRQETPAVQEGQKEVQKSFEEIQKELDEADELNEELKNPEPLEDINTDEKDISDQLKEIQEDLASEKSEQEKTENKSSEEPSQQQMKQTGQKMKNAGQKMKNTAKKMQAMQQGAEMIMMQENLDHLRDILDNLIKVSFEQERILTEIKEVQQIDPRFIELSQEQLKLIDDIEVIEDSLLSLASRVIQISNFVTREVSEINRNLENAMYELRERNKGKATSDQQFAMTSMNNLALLLDDVLSQMQMSMAEAMGNPQSGSNPDKSLPSMSEMQKQLSEQIQQLKQSGKSGRELSEELARLAAEQSELRRSLQEMQESLEGKPGKEGENGKENAGSKLSEAIEKMEENEVDLVNKKITQQLINRQQEILTRMLEAEESMREQKQSPEREGETAGAITRTIPPAIEEYLKAKKREVEPLKTIPLDLNPFYKKEVNDYFRRLSVQEEE